MFVVLSLSPSNGEARVSEGVKNVIHRPFVSLERKWSNDGW